MKLGVAVIIKNSQNKILLFRRAQTEDHDAGYWENCGGELLENEDLETGLNREVFEETGCKLLEFTKIYSDKFGDWEITIFEGKLPENSQIIISPEHDKFDWFSKGELKSLPLASYTRTDFEKIGLI